MTPTPAARRRRELDEWAPTVTRYLGLMLGVVLVVAPLVLPLVTPLSVIEVVTACAGGYPLATGMIFYKNIRKAAADAAGPDDA